MASAATGAGVTELLSAASEGDAVDDDGSLDALVEGATESPVVVEEVADVAGVAGVAGATADGFAAELDDGSELRLAD